MRSRAILVPALLLLAGCGATTAAPTATHPLIASIAPTEPSGPLLVDVDATPVMRAAAGIEVAFDAEGATALIEEVPSTIDFTERALVCVYLGERPTTGWGLSLTSASITNGALAILARETRPGGGARNETTYPADCALLDRSALPVGRLAVRADDTISEEFITDGEVTVPPADGAP